MLADGKQSSPLCHTDGTVGGVIFTFKIFMIVKNIFMIVQIAKIFFHRPFFRTSSSQETTYNSQFYSI